MVARVGNINDTPHTLRMKAAEFRRLATGARDPRTFEDLIQLAADYEVRANELDFVAQIKVGDGIAKDA